MSMYIDVYLHSYLFSPQTEEFITQSEPSSKMENEWPGELGSTGGPETYHINTF